ncbi:MAG: permease [bacterium]
MKWLDDLINNIINSLFGISFGDGIWGNALQFFIYDMIKIGVLLCTLIFAISYIQSYFPPERTKRILSKYSGIKANIIGALLGTVTPFCSCSSIPIFIGFTRAGLSSGVTFSFLISSPLVDLGSLMLLVSFFGWPIAIAYIIVGLVLAVIGGTIIEKTKLGDKVEEIVKGEASINIEDPELSTKDRLNYAKEQMIQTYKKVFIYILIGVGIGCLIHNFIPESFIQSLLGGNNWYSVPLATLLGTPMYADIFGTIPIAESLYLKGAGLGTILSFMMSVTALSLPSLIMLRKVCKPKLLAAFILIIVFGVILIGYLFNLFGYLFI